MDEVQDEVPPEWAGAKERERAAEEAARQARRQRWVKRGSWLAPVILVAGCVIATGAQSLPSDSRKAPAPVRAVPPAAVQSFAQGLPQSQRPNAAGVTVVNDDFAPSTWRVAWETEDSAFCFAFVHQGAPAQTLCDAPGSVRTQGPRILIAGELNDTGIDPPELFTCGYIDGVAGYVEIDGGEVVDPTVDMGSGLTAYCLQLPDGTAPGASFTVSSTVSVPQGGTGARRKDVTVSATYP